MEILQEFLREESVSTCNKKWLTIAKDITEAVRNLLVKGRGECCNIFLKGPSNS